MRRKMVVTMLAVIMSGSAMIAQPAAAEGGCKEFGQNIAFLGTELGQVFGQTASSTGPLNDTVVAEQAVCNE